MRAWRGWTSSEELVYGIVVRAWLIGMDSEETTLGPWFIEWSGPSTLQFRSKVWANPF